MAKTLGKAGRYTSDEAARQENHRLMTGLVMIVLLGFAEGVTVSSFWARLNFPRWVNTTVEWAGICIIALVIVYGFHLLKAARLNRKKWQRGTIGESIVGHILAGFPDDFYVINDLSTPHGNLDHVVVGPTGVFVLDTKNWRGVVQADSRGELVLNGTPTEKAHIRRHVTRIMAVKDKVRALAPGVDAFFQGVFVFSAARVDAPWGKTGAVHCLREDQLWEYIVDKDFGNRLKGDECRAIAQAFPGLAHMDRDFTEKATTAPATSPAWARAAAARA